MSLNRSCKTMFTGKMCIGSMSVNAADNEFVLMYKRENK